MMSERGGRPAGGVTTAARSLSIRDEMTEEMLTRARKACQIEYFMLPDVDDLLRRRDLPHYGERWLYRSDT